ncbi:MAG: putative UDP-N-acetylmuramoylalanyl-D-glutamate-2,6-diaminopimelate ligase [Pseudomonadota bacterium]
MSTAREHELDAESVLHALQGMGVDVRALCVDSRLVKAGDVFLAMPGHAADGRNYIAQAIDAGASAVVWHSEGFVWAEPREIANIGVPNLSAIAGTLAHLVYGRPTTSLWTVGVTGTNGKTSVSQWIARALNEAGRKCAVVGTLGEGFPGALAPTRNTTPDAISLHGALARFVDAGAQAVAMEVSSIGLDQGRVEGVHFDVAVFTNLTRDHLDYHQSMEAYGAAKAKLFAMPGLKYAVINLDDEFGLALAKSLAGRVDRIGYTQQGAPFGPLVAERVIVASRVDVSGAGLSFSVMVGDEEAQAHAYLAGQFNVSNLLAVIGTLIASGFSLEEAAQLTWNLTPPPGRMQLLGGVGEPLVVVDYAHTPDALESVLKALRPNATARGGKLKCVFGCGGERDPGKRSMMGEIASRLADEVIITSDNPRSEDPQRIIDAVRAGAMSSALSIVDRAEAIMTALAQARADDVVLLAGKGHETYQEMAGARVPFSDLEVARAGLRRWAEGVVS